MVDFSSVAIEVLWLLGTAAAAVIGVLAWKVTSRLPLDYEMFIVETQTGDGRRVIQVAQLGYEERGMAGTDLLPRLAASRVLPWVDDLSIVIQSPSTILETGPGFSTTRSDGGVEGMSGMRVWQMEVEGLPLSPAHNSSIAAAAAIAISHGRTSLLTSSGATLRLREVAPAVSAVAEAISPSLPASSLDSSHIYTVSGESDAGGVNRESFSTREERPESASNGESARDGAGFHSSAPSTSAQEEERVHSDPEDQISIRLKFLDETWREVRVRPSTSVAELRRASLADFLAAGRSLRFIFGGQVLRDDALLCDVGVADGGVLHVLVGPSTHPTPHPSTVPPVESHGQEGQNGQERENVEEELAERWAQTRQYLHALLLLSAAFADHLADTLSRWLSWLSGDRLAIAEQPSNTVQTMHHWLSTLSALWSSATGWELAVSAFSLLLPLILGSQLALLWCLAFVFPRFFDRLALSLLSLISLVFLYIYAIRFPFPFIPNRIRRQ